MATRTYPSSIVGLPFPNDRGELCSLVATLLSTGDVVDLRRQPDNPHDPNAIAIYVIDEGEGPHVGWAPARHAAWIGEQLDSGRGLVATVGAIHRNARGRIVNVDLDIELTR